MYLDEGSDPEVFFLPMIVGVTYFFYYDYTHPEYEVNLIDHKKDYYLLVDYDLLETLEQTQGE